MKLPAVYPILDTSALERAEMMLVDAAAALLEGGAEILQLRHKGFWSRAVFEDAKRIAALCGEAGARFVINDRADFAALAGADLHLGQEDLSPVDARKVVGSAVAIGFSTHNEEQLRAAEAEPVDYVAFGPVFGTASKERPDATVGLAGLREARRLTERPLVAIGGIGLESAALCREAGADSVAVIAALLEAHCTCLVLRERMAEWRRTVQ